MNATMFYAAVILSSIGSGYIVYARKQRNLITLISGVALCGIPYVISNIILLAAAGIVLMALPFLISY